MLEKPHANSALRNAHGRGALRRAAARAAALFPAGEIRISAIGLAIFAVYLPVAVLVHSYHIEVPRPGGKVIEMMGAFDLDKPDRYVTRSYVFRPARYPDPSQLSVYEDMMPLPPEKVWFMTDIGDYVIRIRASDNSDPRTNGRHYWLVLP